MVQGQIEPDVKKRMITHMNQDHSDAVLNYVKVFAGVYDATEAHLLDVSLEDLQVEYRCNQQASEACRIPFKNTAASAEDIRHILVDMAHRARQVLDEPKSSGE